MTLTARRVRRARRLIAANRCHQGPGITHRWREGSGFDPMSFGAVIEWFECDKCGEVEWR